MSDTPDLNIENYSLEDLLELIGITSVQTKESIRSAINSVVSQFEALKNIPAVTFFKEVGEKMNIMIAVVLLQHLLKIYQIDEITYLFWNLQII
ncbi:MAG: hypothetical protein ACXADW_11730 [Candidatus Hodarchaeales archaeon]|jgi:hypothetical protein